MGYVTIIRNKLHGQNNKGSGPSGKYMAGDQVDDTMEPVEQLDRWIAAGVARSSSDINAEEAKRRGEQAIAEQRMESRKAAAENSMSIFDQLSKDERDEINYEVGDEGIEEAVIQEVKQKRRRGRPRKNETRS